MKKAVWKKGISIVLAIVMMMAMIPTFDIPVLAGDKTGDDGVANQGFIVPVTHQKTVPDGYTGIYTAQDLDNIRNNMSGKYILMNDIDLSGWGNWEPIGYYNPSAFHTTANSFTGTFDGNGYIIKGLTIIRSITVATQGCNALFGYALNAVVKNVGMVDTNIDITTSASVSIHAAGLIAFGYGYQNEFSLENCYSINGRINVSGNHQNTAGGIIATNTGNYSDINKTYAKDCYNTGMVRVSGGTINDAGGIIGEITSFLVENCYNVGSISSSGSYSYGGGIAGSMSGRINNCYNLGNITAANYCGGIAGSFSTGGITNSNNCYNLGGITARPATGVTAYAGGISGISGTGEHANCYNIGKIDAELTGSSSAYLAGIFGRSEATDVYVSSPNNSFKLENCYNAGMLGTGSGKYRSGLIGVHRRSASISKRYNSLINCYYINDAASYVYSGLSYFDKVENVATLTDSQMKMASSFSGFDFNMVWGIASGINNGYPYLRGTPALDPLSFEALDPDDALNFIRFLYNDSGKLNSSLSDGDIKANNYYKLITGQYYNNPEKEEATRIAFLLFVYAQLNHHIESSSYMLEYTRLNLQNYFEKKLSGMKDIPEQEYNTYVNNLLGNIEEAIVDGLTGVAAKTTGIYITEDVIDTLELVQGGYKQIMGLPSKIENFVDTAVAAINFAFSPLAAELTGRYSYFNSYLDLRPLKDTSKEAFQLAMDYNFFAIQENTYWALGFMYCIPGVKAWAECRDILDCWAEFVYQLEQSVSAAPPTNPLQAISLNKTASTLNKGQTETLSVLYNPADTTDDTTVTWSTSNSNVATVNNGVVTAQNPGTATITAKVGTKEATCIVTVNKTNQATLTITNPGTKTYGDAAFQLSTGTTGSGTGSVSYEYVSGPGSVTSGGIVTITGAGSIVVKATKAGDDNYNAVTSANLIIIVNKANPTVTWPTGLTVTFGQTLSVVTLPSNGAGIFKWTTPSDAVGAVGIRAHNMTFMPTDGNNYNTITQNVNITVNAAPITNAVINVTAPVTAIAPSTSASGTGNFAIGTVSWTPGDNPFQGSKKYTATVTLTANTGYTFTGMTGATINGHTATVSNNTGNTVTLSYQFAATNAATVTGIQIVSQPAKLSYTYNEALDLTGLSVKLIYNDGTDETIPFENFATKNITTNPTNGTVMTMEYIDTAIEVSCGNQSVSTNNLMVKALTHAEMPNITSHPDDRTVNLSDAVTLSVAANVSKGTLSYQWYENTSRTNVGGTTILGATQSSYTAPTGTAGTKYFYCVVTNTDNTVTGSKIATAVSNVVSVMVHEHIYGEYITSIEPTCVLPGEKYRICSVCDHEDTQTIDALGHDFKDEWTVDIPANCTEPGSKSLHCTRCDTKDDILSLPAIGHTFGDWETITSATCTDGGAEKRVCSVCVYVETRNIDPTGHTWENDFTVDKAPTCTENGSKSIHCSVCDAVKDSTVIPAAGHTFGAWEIITSSTCTDDGAEKRVCSICNFAEIRNIDPTGHTWENDFTVDKAPTCTENGSKSIHCSACDAIKDSTVILATGHIFGEWEAVSSSDCIDNGAEKRICSACGFAETRNIDPFGHEWQSDFTVDKAPTCTENGSKSIHCSACDARKDSTVILATGHIFGAWIVTTPATATTAGIRSHSCSVCRKTETERVEPLTQNNSNPSVKKQLSKPKGLILTAKKAKWKNVANNNGYTLQVKQGKKVLYKVNIKKNKKSYTFTKKQCKKFEKGKKYTFTLVAKGTGNYKNSKTAKSKARIIKK